MAKNADFMAMGYAAMGLLLFGMIAWTYFRYRVLYRENDMIDDFVAEELAERGESAPSTSSVDVSGAPVAEEA